MKFYTCPSRISLAQANDLSRLEGNKTFTGGVIYDTQPDRVLEVTGN